TSENTMDMLEQRQAMEQARLLQRFKELRQWQMQQQEVLMKQQQMQLEILRKEQLSAQGLIVKQRESHWGGKVKLADNTTRTPPRSTRHHPHRGQGHAKAKGQSQPPQTSQQRVGQLPAPVMYVPLNDDNDEIKTNPDLFSDTNSQLQSPRTTVAKQLEATLKRGGQQTGQVPSQVLNSVSVPVVTKPATNNKISALKNQKDKDVVKDYIDRELGHKGQGRLSDVREDTEGEEKEIEDDNDDDDDSEFELSESESESSSDSDSESENSRTLTSPSKVMTRKIASNRDRTSLNSAYTTDRTGESVVVNEKTALDTVNNLLKRLTEKQLGSQVVEKQLISSEPTQLSMEFSQPIKSPIVISKEGGEIRDFRKNDNNGVDHDGSFHLHGKFSSQGGMFGVNKVVSKSDDDAELSDGSLSSYSDLKISKRQQNYGDSENEQRIGSNYPNNDSSQSESEDVKDSDEEDRFDDEEEWNDLTPKAKSPAKHSHFGDMEEGPPTSKLVSKLFPNLKPPQTKQQAENQQRLQSVTSAATSDGVQSKLMREKLTQLEMEIEKFKNENLNLERLRKEREEGLAKLKKEIAAFEKEKSEELKRLQEYKIEETKKLKHEKKMFEKYQKAAREMPNKKEREEIEMLKSQLTDLQDEMKRKESRWTSNNARLRSKLELLEQENTELKEEIKLMEMKRLEWLQKEQNTKKGVQRNIGTTNAAYSQKISKQFTSNSADFQTTDSDEETDPVRDESNPHSLQDTVNSNTMSLRPSQYENLVNVRAPPANSKTAPTQQKLPAPSGGHVSKMAASTKGHEKPNASRMGQNKSTNAEKSVTCRLNHLNRPSLGRRHCCLCPHSSYMKIYPEENLP
ncbi:hypothetical protein FSP39_002942, partial [Pinctada imbricata]